MIGTMLAASGFAVGCLLIGEGYFLIARAQRLLDYAEQLQQAGALLLAAVPSKSAPRTDGSSDVPAEHFTALDTRPQPIVRPVPVDTVEAHVVVQETVAAITAEAMHYGRHAAHRMPRGVR